MSDEAKSKGRKADESARSSGEWTLPEPVFRSTEGRSPTEYAAARELKIDVEDEIPTDMMGFESDETSPADDEAPSPDADGAASDEPHIQTVRVKEKPSRRHHKKKRSQSKLMTGLALAVGLLIGGVILAVIYFLFK